MSELPEDQLRQCGQSRLIDVWKSLEEPARSRFAADLLSIDWSRIERLWRRGISSESSAATQKIQSPRALIRLPETEGQRQEWAAARQAGRDLLAAGRAACIVVAGGQGTRLDFDKPKGMFPVGPLSGKSLFQWFAEQLATRERHAGQTIPWIIMTSNATHSETVAFFEEQSFFGRAPETTTFVCQGTMPAVDAKTGEALLEGPGELALSPDGHGGLLDALERDKMFDRLAELGIDTLFYHQIDNPTTRVCDPAFLGWHLREEADVSTKVVEKIAAAEKMGIAVERDGVSCIIEYSDLPDELANQTDARGRLEFWAGNTAIHVFRREFLESVARSESGLPFHCARKKVPYLDDEQRLVTPDEPNGMKFERFIFDVIPAAKKALFVQGNRKEEFNPIKNASGSDSPETSRSALLALHKRWLVEAGIPVPDDARIEIAPIVATTAEELRDAIPRIRQPVSGDVILDASTLAPE